MKQHKIFFPPSIICTNCSEKGHQSKQCQQPITSYGAILFRIQDNWKQAEALLQGNLTGLEEVHSKIEFLLIQRRDTIGFIEIMRGKYRTNDIDYILQHLSCMTGEEHNKLLTKDFDSLWEELWGPPIEGSHAYKNEKEQAKLKLEAIRPQLLRLISKCTAWKEPEWGFPKGRRDNYESEYTCAMREMWEETNINERDVYPIRNMDPIVEIFHGTNNIQYSHKYYIVYTPAGIGEETVEIAAENNKHIKREVRQIRWFSYEDAITHIRPEHVEKRDLLLRVNKILQTYCPLALNLRQ